MEAVKLSSVLSFHLAATNSPTLHRSRIETPPVFNRLPFNGRLAFSPLSSMPDKTRTTGVAVRVSTSPTSEIAEPPEPAVEIPEGEEKYDWYAQWYPLMPVCDLDKRIPHAKRVMGIDVVVWWDRNENAWKVFGDYCPHRLAPLSEGRIDQWGRLQCVYHGWCFNGSGDCKFIPQAPPDGPPVNTFKKACTSVYPSTVQNDMVWFWPNSDPQYKDILTKEKPPFIPEIDDPSYTRMFGNREINYGYELLIENLMDPAHVPYAHYGIMNVPKPKEKADREGGRPLDISLMKSDINGFLARQDRGYSQFMAPCVFYFYSPLPGDESIGPPPGAKTVEKSSASGVSNKRVLLIFICVPVSPGKSRLIWVFPRNFGHWIDKIVPRWVFHVGQNLVLDSDQYLLHVEEYKIKEIGPTNWQKSCFVPTKSDALVITFRRWLNKYSNGEVDWRGKFSGGHLLPSPPREQLMDRYWTHVVNCSSCRVAHKGLNILEVALQVAAVVSLAIAASVKQNAMSTATRNILVITAVLCFVGSKWLSHFVYKTFRYHDYYHALR